MKFRLYIFLLFFALASCKNSSETKPKKPQTLADNKTEKSDFHEYRSEDFQVVLKYSEDYAVKEDSLPDKTPVLNIFKKNNSGTPPFIIHEDFQNAYIAFLSRGFGVDGPAGTRERLGDYGNRLPLSFEVDEKRSQVFLLENGEAWGYHLRFTTPPESWSETGGIFIRYRVNDLDARCYSENNENLPMEECDPLDGHTVEYTGEVDPHTKKELDEILQSLWFFRENYERKEISDLIKIEAPQPGEKLESPFKIHGEARGHWLFEATAPVELVDENFQPLTKTYIQAVSSEWMTEDFIDIEGSLEF